MPKILFKKGKPGGPGRPKMSEEEKRINRAVNNSRKLEEKKYAKMRPLVTRMNRDQFVNGMHLYLDKTLNELQELFGRGDLPSRDMIIIGSIVEAVRRGDLSRLDWFMQKMFDEDLGPSDLFSVLHNIRPDFSRMKDENIVTIGEVLLNDDIPL